VLIITNYSPVFSAETVLTNIGVTKGPSRTLPRDVAQYTNSGDFGVAIEETRGDGLYLGQVKCYADYNQVTFDPFAIIHFTDGQAKRKGGYVITTRAFQRTPKNMPKGLT
jgi:hypothetical protein